MFGNFLMENYVLFISKFLCLIFVHCRCKMYPDMSYIESSTTTETLVLGVGPEKTSFGAMEMGESPVAENGCKCGSDCKCDPCTCNK